METTLQSVSPFLESGKHMISFQENFEKSTLSNTKTIESWFTERENYPNIVFLAAGNVEAEWVLENVSRLLDYPLEQLHEQNL